MEGETKENNQNQNQNMEKAQQQAQIIKQIVQNKQKQQKVIQQHEDQIKKQKQNDSKNNNEHNRIISSDYIDSQQSIQTQSATLLEFKPIQIIQQPKRINSFFNFKNKKKNPLQLDIEDQQIQDIQLLEKQNQLLKQKEQYKLKRESQNSNSQSFQSSKSINLKDLAFGVLMSQTKQQIQEAVDLMKPQVQINITEVIQKGNTLSKYFVYTIKGKDQHGRFLVRRKYSQFIALRKILFQRWPGCYIPGLKNKIEVQNQKVRENIQIKILVGFLIGLSYSKYLYYKQEVQLFLRSDGIDIQLMYHQMPKLQNSDIMDRYISVFGEQITKNKGSQVTQKMNKFHKKLRKIVNSLGEMSQRALKLAQSYDIYTNNISKFGQIIRCYQHYSLAQFTNNNREMTIFVKDDQNHIQKMKKIYSENTFYQLYILLLLQTNDVQSYLDVIIVIGLYQMRIQQLEQQIKTLKNQNIQITQGHKTIKTITTRKSKEDILKEIQQKLIKLQKQIQQVKRINIVVQNVVVNIVIPFFKNLKKNNYRSVLTKWVNITQTQIPELQSIWKFVNYQSKDILKKVQGNKG